MSRIAEIKKALKDAPKDRQVTGGNSYFNSEEWAVIDEAYEGGTSLTTIYDRLPVPKNKSYKAFKESYRNWKKAQKEIAAQT